MILASVLRRGELRTCCPGILTGVMGDHVTLELAQSNHYRSSTNRRTFTHISIVLLRVCPAPSDSSGGAGISAACPLSSLSGESSTLF